MSNYYSYTVTRDGRVFNKHGKLLAPSNNGKGYLAVGIRHDGRKTTKTLHRLVAEVYIPNPKNLSDVDHIDCNRKNNHVDNLRWVTHGENIQHSYDTLNRSARGSVNANAKHDDMDIHNICYLLSRGFTPPRIRDMGYGYSTVRDIRNNKRWKHISSLYSS